MTALVALGFIIFFPSLATPFFLDDYIQSAMVHGRFPGDRGPLDLYDFVADDNRDALFGRGFLPWWTDPHLTVRFLRPLSSLFLWGEHAAFDAHPWVMHAHSFLWWVGAVSAARWLFRMCLPARTAGLATIIFALAPCHVIPLGWLANREALISLTLGTVGLAAALSWQRGGGVKMAALSTVAFALAMAAGEYAVACGGYVLMFAWRIPPATKRRWGMVLFFAVPVAGYLVCRSVLGYRAVGSGFYQDPLHDTGLYLSHAPWRVLALGLTAWFAEDTIEWQWGASKIPVGLALAAQAALLWWALRYALARVSEDHRRNTLTFLWGSILALVPLLSVEPSVRLLGVVMLGVGAVVAVILAVAWFATESEARHGIEEWTAIAATLLGFAHLVHGAGSSWLQSRQMKIYATAFRQHAREMADRLRDHPDAHVIVVRGLDDVFFYGFAIDAFGVPSPRISVLSHTGHVLTLRHDAEALDIVAGADSALYAVTFGDLYRGELDRLAEGNAIAGDGFVVTVGDVTAVGPRRARFQFDRDLDDPSFIWVGESRKGFTAALPPKIGFGTPQDP